MNHQNLKKELRIYASPVKAKNSLRFFKTGKGSYSEKDRFLGVTIPELRKIVKKYEMLPLTENRKLLHSVWHEERMLALLILGEQYKKSFSEKEQKAIFKYYIQNKKWVNNWDLVDATAPYISGHWIYHQKQQKILFQLAKSQNLWDRRIAVVSTAYFIRQKKFQEILKLSEMLMFDEEDLMHKACGWMLREVGKRDLKILRQFLKKNSHRMPRTMLRYCIEKMSKSERTKWLGKR